MIYKDENGNDVEVFTAEELDTKVEEARVAALEEAMDYGDTDLKEKYDKAQKELDEIKAKSKDMSGNLSGQRQVIKAKEDEVSTLRTQFNELSKSQAQVLADLKGSTVRTKINNLTSDAEVATKALKYYNDFFADKVKEEGDIDSFIKNSLLLVTGGTSQVDTASYSSNMGESPDMKVSKDGKLSPIGVGLAKAMNLDMADLKKHKLL